MAGMALVDVAGVDGLGEEGFWDGQEGFVWVVYRVAARMQGILGVDVV